MRLLYVLCEGDDDQQFIERVVEPRLSYADHEVKYFQYAEYSAKEVRRLIRSIDGMRSDGLEADYLFFRDFDRAPCKQLHFEEIDRQYDELISRDRTFLVVQMIESWYVAGLEKQHPLSTLGNAPPQTNDLIKQDFENLMDENANRTNVLQEILKHFDLDRARYKNRSFEYFCSHVLD